MSSRNRRSQSEFAGTLNSLSNRNRVYCKTPYRKFLHDYYAVLKNELKDRKRLRRQTVTRGGSAQKKKSRSSTFRISRFSSSRNRFEHLISTNTPIRKENKTSLELQNQNLQYSDYQILIEDINKQIEQIDGPDKCKQEIQQFLNQPENIKLLEDYYRSRYAIPCCLKNLPPYGSSKMLECLMRMLSQNTGKGEVTEEDKLIFNKIKQLHKLLSATKFNDVCQNRPRSKSPANYTTQETLKILQIRDPMDEVNDLVLIMESIPAIDERVIYANDSIADAEYEPITTCPDMAGETTAKHCANKSEANIKPVSHSITSEMGEMQSVHQLATDEIRKSRLPHHLKKVVASPKVETLEDD